MSTNVIRITKKTTGTIHRMRLPMKIARLPDRLSVSDASREGNRAPRLGRPAITAKKSLLVLGYVGAAPAKVAGQVLVVAGGNGQPAHVGLDQVVFVGLVHETDDGIVDQQLLRRQVVLVALGLIDRGVRLVDQVVVAGYGRAAPVEVVASPGQE